MKKKEPYLFCLLRCPKTRLSFMRPHDSLIVRFKNITYRHLPYKIFLYSFFTYICKKKQVIMGTAIKEHARFDARLSKEQKQFFEKAAYLGGYRSLTDFVILTVQEKA